MTPDEALQIVKNEVHALVEKLPVTKIESLRAELQIEVDKFAISPQIKEAESRFHSIIAHLWNGLERGEHEVVTAVHEFLISRKVIPTPAPAAAAPEAPAEVPPAAASEGPQQTPEANAQA